MPAHVASPNRLAGQERSARAQDQSDEIVAAVKRNGVPVEYLVFDDEGHGFRKQNHLIAAQEAYLEFLDTYLRGR
jgi:dipeptidyl aminopeptidase/acylaminoacyl peptidase